MTDSISRQDLKVDPSPAFEGVKVKSLADGMGNGISYSIGEVTDKHVTVVERIDLTHPNCPVVCLNKDAAFIEQRYPMSPTEYLERFGQPERRAPR